MRRAACEAARPRREDVPGAGGSARAARRPAQGERQARAGRRRAAERATVIGDENHRLQASTTGEQARSIWYAQCSRPGGSPLPAGLHVPRDCPTGSPGGEGEPRLALRLHDRRTRDGGRARRRLAPRGGTAFYSALQAARLGLRALIVHARRARRDRSAARAPPRRARADGCMPAPRTTTLRTAARAPGAASACWRGPGPIGAEDLELDTAILHLAPVARETPAAGVGRGRAPFVGLTPQGLVREWGGAGRPRSRRSRPWAPRRLSPRSRSGDRDASSSASTSAPAARS